MSKGDAQYDHMFKLLLTGDSGVGKSSILVRFIDDVFEIEQPSTIGVDFKVKAVTVNEKKVKLTIWDTAGQERFRTLTSSYYRGAQGVILVYDVTRKETLSNLEAWLKEVNMYTSKSGVILMLVGNKIDKTANREVTHQEGVNFAKEHGMLFIECSAKTKAGIIQAFEELVQKIMDSPQLRNSEPGGGVNVAQGGGAGGGCGC